MLNVAEIRFATIFLNFKPMANVFLLNRFPKKIFFFKKDLLDFVKETLDYQSFDESYDSKDRF